MSTDPTDPVPRTEWLLLIPTEFERGFIADSLAIPGAVLAVCGFGPVLPAARTVQLIGQHRPQRVLLLGIAGKYDSRLEIGQACVFDQVSIHGIGVGSGATFQTAEDMGWTQWQDVDPERSIGDTLMLSNPANVAQPPMQLLTVCSSANSPMEVAHRQSRFPSTVAEDMEGFAVAAACKLSNVPLTIVRGISNQAGDREKQNWRIRQAMISAADVCREIVE